MTVETGKQTLEFQTEVRQLLNLMIHSLYSNKEIFLRELISNASDAIDKMRFKAQTEAGILGDDTEFKIKIERDAIKNTLTVADNGIGMDGETREKAFSLFFSSKGTQGTGMGLFIATPSYNGKISFNVTSTRETMPDIEFFIECIEASLQELRKATAPRKPRAAGKKKTKKKTKKKSLQ